IEKQAEEYEQKLHAIDIRTQELEKMYEKQVAELSNISGISKEDAKAALVETLKDEARADAMVYIKEITDEAKLDANKKAKKIVIESIQRVATEQAIENAVSVFNLESDEIKG